MTQPTDAADPLNARPPPRSASDTPLGAWTRALANISPFHHGNGPILASQLMAAAQGVESRPALLSRRETLTYGALAERAQAYGQWALDQGVGPGEAVCLLMPNRPEYVAIWVGVTSRSRVVALLNTGLVGDALVHAIASAAARFIIVDEAMADRLEAIAHRLPQGTRIWAHGPSRRWPRVDAYVDRLRPPASPPDRCTARLDDLALLIYTSGTTGLPKAVKVSHRRIVEWSAWFAGMLDIRPADRMYNCLPMYHSVGGVVAVGAMLVAGGSVLVRERFSATQFWDEIVEGGCTIFQYIGELCRYLVASPPHRFETDHEVRVCCGNGLRGDVWATFQQRFRIPRILEFYASTEGNLSLYNCEGKIGAIGRIPPFLAHRFPVAIIRVNLETLEPLRGTDGLCIVCEPGEVGEAVGRISARGAASGRPFEGYMDAEATERKILSNVVALGDAWFRSGDLMRSDKAGYYYFVDRAGDTYRWKGENVSTEQVAAALRGCKGITDAVVYPVSVPGTEGRAGMAAIAVQEPFDLAALRQELTRALPDYAHPLFVRVRERIGMTGTFKPVKADMARAGYDPADIRDPLYFNDRARGAFVRLDADFHGRIVSGAIRL